MLSYLAYIAYVLIIVADSLAWLATIMVVFG